jgi:hypothetical protein
MSAQRTAVKQRPHPETEAASGSDERARGYITTGEQEDGAGGDEARPSASTACRAALAKSLSDDRSGDNSCGETTIRTLGIVRSSGQTLP